MWSCGRTVFDAEPLTSLSWRFSLAVRHVTRYISLLTGKCEAVSGLNFSWLAGTKSLVKFSDKYAKLSGLLTVEMPEVCTVCRKSVCLWSCLSAFGLWEWLFSTLGRWLWSLAEITCPELSHILIWASHLLVKHLSSQTCLAKMNLLLQFWSTSFYEFEKEIYPATHFCVSEMPTWQSSCIKHR